LEYEVKSRVPGKNIRRKTLLTRKPLSFILKSKNDMASRLFNLNDVKESYLLSYGRSVDANEKKSYNAIALLNLQTIASNRLYKESKNEYEKTNCRGHCFRFVYSFCRDGFLPRGWQSRDGSVDQNRKFKKFADDSAGQLCFRHEPGQ